MYEQHLLRHLRLKITKLNLKIGAAWTDNRLSGLVYGKGVLLLVSTQTERFFFPHLIWSSEEICCKHSTLILNRPLGGSG